MTGTGSSARNASLADLGRASHPGWFDGHLYQRLVPGRTAATQTAVEFGPPRFSQPGACNVDPTNVQRMDDSHGRRHGVVRVPVPCRRRRACAGRRSGTSRGRCQAFRRQRPAAVDVHARSSQGPHRDACRSRTSATSTRPRRASSPSRRTSRSWPMRATSPGTWAATNGCCRTRTSPASTRRCSARPCSTWPTACTKSCLGASTRCAASTWPTSASSRATPAGSSSIR